MPKLLMPVVRRLATYFLAGVFAILPLVITAVVVIWVTGMVGEIVGDESLLGGLIKRLGGNVAPDSKMAYFIGCVTPAEMSVDGLMSIYVSMGITAPEFLKPVRHGSTPA